MRPKLAPFNIQLMNRKQKMLATQKRQLMMRMEIFMLLVTFLFGLIGHKLWMFSKEVEKEEKAVSN